MYREKVDTINIAEFIKDLAFLNLEYLFAALAVIGFLGAIFYIFSLKPFFEKIEKQEKELRAFKDKISGDQRKSSERLQLGLNERIDSISDSTRNQLLDFSNQLQAKSDALEEKIDMGITKEVSETKEKISEMKSEVETKIKLLERQSRDLKLDSLFNEFWVWFVAKIPANMLDSLNAYLNKLVEYETEGLRNFALERIKAILSEKDSAEKLSDESSVRVLRNLSTTIDKVKVREDKEELKREIKELIGELLTRVPEQK